MWSMALSAGWEMGWGVRGLTVWLEKESAILVVGGRGESCVVGGIE